MLNVDRVFTTKWTTLNKVRDYVNSLISEATSRGATLTATDIQNALNTAQDGQFAPTSAFSDFQTTNGVVIPDTASCIDISIDAYKNALGEDIDTTTETHVGRMIEETGKIMADVIGLTAANVMQTDINSATGCYLDALASLFFAQRKSEQHTSVTVSLSASTAGASVTLNNGEAEFTDGDGVKYAYIGESTTVTTGTLIRFVCEKAGAYVPNATGVSWTLPEGIATPSSSYPFSSYETGYDKESDDVFRERLKKARVTSVDFMESVSSGLFGLDGVYDAKVLENCATTQQTISGVSIPGHSIAVIVDYDGSETTKKNIARTIWEKKSVGCGYKTDAIVSGETPVTCSVTDPYFGTVYQVYFHKPVSVQFGVHVDVSSHNYTGRDLEATVRAALIAWANGDVPYVDGLKIGQSIKAYEIGAAISAKIPDIQIDLVELYDTPPSGSTRTGLTKIPVSAYQIGIINTNDITIHIDVEHN